LDGHETGNTAEDGGFLISHVRNGTHRLRVQLLGAREATKTFSIDEGKTELAVGDISMTPLFELGYVVAPGPPRFSGGEFVGTYDLYLWTDAPQGAVGPISGVLYELPRPLPDATVRRTNAARSFCYHQHGELPRLQIAQFGSTTAVVDLGGSQHISIGAARPKSQGRFPSCPATVGPRAALPTPAPTPTPSPTPTPTPTPTPNPLANVIVPNVLGTPVEEAQARLQSFNLVPQIAVVASETPPGRVVMQRPAAGVRVMPNSVVEISVSNGGGSITAVPGE